MRQTRSLASLQTLALLIAPALAALPSSVQSNEATLPKRSLYTYVDEVSRRWCGTVGYVDANGPGGVSFAWFVFDAEPRRMVHVPMMELLSGCAAHR